jgi:hypothetical protein
MMNSAFLRKIGLVASGCLLMAGGARAQVSSIAFTSFVLPTGASLPFLFSQNTTGGATASLVSSSLTAGQSTNFTYGTAANPAYRVRTTASADSSASLSGTSNIAFTTSLGSVVFNPSLTFSGFFFTGAPNELNAILNGPVVQNVTINGDQGFRLTINAATGPTSNTNTSFIETTSGSLTYLGTVPEPSTVALLGLTLLPGAALLRRRRK